MSRPKSVTNPCCESAERILDQSQGHASYSSPFPGHPRYHVLCNNNYDKFTIINDLPTLGCTEAVTEHLHNTKTAFLNKRDQNSCLHDILTSAAGKTAIKLLNENCNEILVRVSASYLPNSQNLRMVQVIQGDRMEEQPAVSFVIIFGHHVDKPEGRYVHVKTFYPTNRYITNFQLEKLHC